MHYLSSIIENTQVQSEISKYEANIYEFLNNNINDFTYNNFKYIFENIKMFQMDSVLETHRNIRDFIINDMVNMLGAVTEVASIDESFNFINQVMEDTSNISSVFTGVGYGIQKAQNLLECVYEEEDE